MHPFTVNISRSGSQELEFTADKEFFEAFGFTDVLGADICVHAFVAVHGATVDVECDIDGTLTLPCDRCLEPLEIPVSTGFSESYTPGGPELDLSQDVYDYVCTALPLQRVHPEGECNPDTVKYLCK